MEIMQCNKVDVTFSSNFQVHFSTLTQKKKLIRDKLTGLGGDVNTSSSLISFLRLSASNELNLGFFELASILSDTCTGLSLSNASALKMVYSQDEYLE